VEQWRAVVGWETLYEVSDLGQVRSIARQSIRGDRPYTIRGRVLKPRRDTNDRLGVMLYDTQGKGHERRVHLLVLEAFVGPRPAGLEGCHWDDDHDNNRLENLRWATRSENEYDKVRNGNQYNAVKTECKSGHEFTPENTILRPGKNGRTWRQCRECLRIINREAQRERRANRGKVSGLCGQCGKPRDNLLFKLCDSCRARIRNAAQKRRHPPGTA